MTRKHYSEIANMLDTERRIAPDATNVTTIRTIAFQLAQIMKRDNPRFNAGKFFDAAGFPELTNTAQGLG